MQSSNRGVEGMNGGFSREGGEAVQCKQSEIGTFTDMGRAGDIKVEYKYKTMNPKSR